MPHSYAQHTDVTCPHCGGAFSAEVYLIVDASERPDLMERIRDGTLHDLSCPHCQQSVGAVDAPLLLYRPDEAPPLIFSPAERTTDEEDQRHAAGLMGLLNERLGDDWQDEWIEQGLRPIPRSLLPAALGGDPQAALRQMAEQVQQALEELRDRDPEAYRQLEEAAQQMAEEMPPLVQTLQEFVRAENWFASRQVVEAHPELLSDEADALMERLVSAAREQGDADAERIFTEHRDLLRRCRAVGVAQAFAEKAGLSPEAMAAAEVFAQLPPEVREVLVELVASGAINSPQDLERALAERPDLMEKLQQAAGAAAGAPDVPPEFRDDIRRAQESKQRYLRVSDLSALDAAAAAWERVLNHPAFSDAPSRFQCAAFNDAGGVFLRRYWARGRLDDLDRALHLWQQAVEATPADAPDLPARLNNLGTGLSDRYARTGRLEDRSRAVTAWEEACQKGLERSLEETLRAARNWGNFALEQRAWEEAVRACGYGLEAAEQLYRVQLSRASQEAWLREAQGLPARAAYALSRADRLPEAAVVLEQGRARGLNEALARDRTNLERVKEVDAEAHDLYYQAAARLRQLESAERTEGSALAGGGRRLTASASLREQARQARDDMDAAIARIRRIPGYENFLFEADFNDVAAAVQPGAPLVYLVTTPVGSMALIVHRDSNTPTLQHSNTPTDVVWADEFTEARLRELLRGWFGAYLRWHEQPKDITALNGWLDTLEETTRQLWDELMGRVVNRLQTLGAEQAVLIPTGLLSLLPLHAAWTRQNGRRRCALDEVVLSYAPSARALTRARRVAAVTADGQLLAVDDPNQTLPNSTPEVTAIASLFDDPRVFQHRECIRRAVLEALRQAAVAHFSCHGATNWNNPLQSGLLMVNNEMLTVQDIFDLHLSGARMATLSACETGIVGVELPDEVVMLPSAFLRAGFAGVVASLWAVTDLSTAMLMERFYRLWREEGQPPCHALRNAQQWLRDTTNREKADYFGRDVPELSGVKMPAVTAAGFYENRMLQLPDARDFEHPFFWAAFYLTGV